MRLSLACIVSLATSLAAQYTQDMEALTASAGGTIITGQDLFYVPVAGSLNGNVFTYAGNTLGVPTNANGGNNFYAGVSQAGNQFARAQRPITLPLGVVRIEVDVLINYIGIGTPAQYPGSLSLQPSGSSTFSNMLSGWASTAPPYTWDCLLQSGTSIIAVPDPAFAGLDANVWHRWGITIDLATGVYLEFSITNGTTNVTTVVAPSPPLPLGGSGPFPTEFRFFTGGGTGDNVSAYDNLVISYGASYTPFGAGCAGSTGVPTLAAAPGSSPRLGTTFQADVGNLPQGLAVITSGFSNTLALGSIALPFDLTGTGFPGCFLLVDPLISEFLIGTGSTATWNFPIPPAPGLAGIKLWQQAIGLDTVAPGAAFSNGSELVVGY